MKSPHLKKLVRRRHCKPVGRIEYAMPPSLVYRSLKRGDHTAWRWRPTTDKHRYVNRMRMRDAQAQVSGYVEDAGVSSALHLRLIAL